MTGNSWAQVGRTLLRRIFTLALVAATAATAAAGAAEQPGSQGLHPRLAKGAAVYVTPPLRSIKVPPTPRGPSGGAQKEIPIGVPAFLRNRPAPTPQPDPLARSFASQRVPGTTLSFEGYSNDDNTALFGGEVAPPDTNGDIGLDYYFQWVNLGFQIYDRTGTSVLGSPLPGNIFWPADTPCGDNNAGDPVVLYDHLASRWVISQFTGTALADGWQCVAVSVTDDALGSYYGYQFLVSPGGFNDYPKIGVWTDGYYLTTNEFAPGFAGVHVTVLEREAMLQGLPANLIQYDLAFTGSAPVRFALAPGHFTGKAPPPPGTCNYIIQAFDDETWGDGLGDPDGYQLWQACTDWSDPMSSTLTELPLLVAPEFDSELCAFNPCIPQPGTAQLLDSLGQFTMNRANIRYFPGTGLRMVVNHTSDVTGSSRAGIRWAKLDLEPTPLNGGGGLAIVQTGTIAPADSLHRWMGSLAYDASGNIGMVYSRSGSTAGNFPSILYTGHEKGVTPVGTMDTELVCQAGGGSQTGTERWGDYASISMDPVDGCTFWLTSEYHPVSDPFTWHTRVCTFKYASCTAEPAGTVEGTVTDVDTLDPIAGALVEVGPFSTVTDANGDYSVDVGVGTYDITASRFGYAPQTVVAVAVTNGSTVTQDFALAPLATVDLSGTVTDGSGAGWPLWARVTIESSVAGQPEIVTYTDPATGAYEVLDELFADTGYDITVEALVPGYTPETRTVTTPPSGSFVEDFVLEIDGAACTAPGYSPTITNLLSEDFAGGIPGTWTVTDTSTACASGIDHWGTVDPRPLSPTISTIVTPLFALIDSDFCGSGANIITDLVTPEFDLSGLSGATDSLSIAFNSDYRDLCTAPGDGVSLDVWDGSAWVTVFNFCGQTMRRNRPEAFATQAANGVANAKFRFHYDSGWDWWWAVDDVEISTSSCSFQGGGLVWGFITDSNTNDPVVGATVSDGTNTTLSVASPDPGQPDGIYFLPSAAGPQTVTATAPSYGTASGAATVVAGDLFRLDLALPSGLLVLNPDPVTIRVPLFTSANLNASVDNIGSADASWSLFEVNAPAPPVAPDPPIMGPIQHVTPRVVDDKARMFSPTARVLPARPARPSFPTIPLSGGEVTADFSTGLPGGPYGNALKDNSSPVPTHTLEVWLGNVAAIAGDDENVQYTSNSLTLTATGTVVAPVATAVFYADATYNQRTDSFWQVNVGGDNCIHEYTAAGFSGAIFCPTFDTSQRGLTYDPLTDTYYSGSFNDGVIVQFASDGTILRQVFKDVDVVGLAFNPVTGHLFAMQNTNSPEPDIVVMDANTPTFDFLNAFDITKNNVSVMADFEQGGLDIDCQGRLWANNFTTGQVFVVSSGEKIACTDIPWLSISPTSGTTTAGSSTPVTMTFDANLASPGYHQAYLILADDTPQGSQNVPVNFTAAFLDVAPGGFDRFIHGLAGAGITAGCGAGNFCPNGNVTRGLMPIWLLLAKYGFHYRPPHATGVLFADVPAESLGADFIEQFYHLGITAGCGTNPLRYCPSTPVTRAQMALFLLRTLEGPGYTPPPAAGIFADVPISNPLAPWIEELFNRGITAGCGVSPLRYCPNGNITRGQMAVFVSLTFDIPVSP